jgi:cytoskeleton protein RodZ
MNKSLPIDSAGGQTQEIPDYKDLHYGEVLKKTRTYYGLSIEEVEKLLRIRSSYIVALEENNLEILPGRVYAIGFLRSYAEFLGLDGDKMTYMFKTQAGNKVQNPTFQVPVSASESKLPSLYILGAALLVLSLVAYGLKFQTSSTSIETTTADIPSVEDVLSAQAVQQLKAIMPDDMYTVTNIAQSLNAIAPAAGDAVLVGQKFAALPMDSVEVNPNQPAVSLEDTVEIHDLTLKIIESAWVEIISPDGKTLVSKVLKPGSEYVVPNKPGTIMNAGNLGGIEVYYKDEMLPKLGLAGDVGKNIDLFVPSDNVSEEGDVAANVLEGDIERQVGSESSVSQDNAPVVSTVKQDTEVTVPAEKKAVKEQPSRRLYEGFPYSGNPYGRLN